MMVLHSQEQRRLERWWAWAVEDHVAQALLPVPKRLEEAAPAGVPGCHASLVIAVAGAWLTMTIRETDLNSELLPSSV